MKTSIRARILRLSIISVGVALASYILLASLSLEYLVREVRSVLVGKDVDIVNNCIQTAYVDMTDLASEICDHSDLREAYAEGDVSDVIINYLGDSWIKGVKVVNGNGSVIYSSGIDCDISKTLYGGSKDNEFIMITSASLGDGRLYLASYPPEIGVFERIIDDKMIDFAVSVDDQIIYSTLGTKNISEKFKLDGKQYFSESKRQDNITVYAIEDLTHMQRLKTQTLLLFYLLAAILIPIAITVSLYVAKKISGSIKNIVNRLELLANGDISTSVLKNNRGDETEVLENTLDRTLVQLQTYLNDIKRYADAIHNGSVGVKSNVEYKGNFRDLYASMKAIQSDLIKIVGETKSAVEYVNSAANEIMQSTQALASGSTEQAASMEEMNSTMHEIAAAVAQNDLDCKSANQASGEAVEAVENVRDNGDKLQTAMKNISDVMGEIEKIFEALKDIAFDTNILAINASIEAAHAGKAGVGFAVVANEVAALADKSRKSVEESTMLLQQLTEVLDRGTELTVQTSSSVYDVEKSIHTLNKNIEKIAEVNSQQTAMLSQVTVGIDNIAVVTQTNSATSDENLSISENLVEQVEKLNQMLKKYNLDEIDNSGFSSETSVSVYDIPEESGGYVKYTSFTDAGSVGYDDSDKLESSFTDVTKGYADEDDVYAEPDEQIERLSDEIE